MPKLKHGNLIGQRPNLFYGLKPIGVCAYVLYDESLPETVIMGKTFRIGVRLFGFLISDRSKIQVSKYFN